MTGEPILIPCEGGEHPGHADITGHLAMCVLCGEVLPTTDDGLVPAHTRDDILARLQRGDFEYDG